MSVINKITKKIAGVEKSRDAGIDSPVRDLLNTHAMCEENPIIADRYMQCACCEHLKEEFKLFGKTIKDMEPACGECGCDLNLKIPIEAFGCPLGKW